MGQKLTEQKKPQNFLKIWKTAKVEKSKIFSILVMSNTIC